MTKPVSKSAPVKSAYRKGFSAGRRGLPEDVNPYTSKDPAAPLVGWSRLYHTTWKEGWLDGSAER